MSDRYLAAFDSLVRHAGLDPKKCHHPIDALSVPRYTGYMNTLHLTREPLKALTSRDPFNFLIEQAEPNGIVAITVRDEDDVVTMEPTAFLAWLDAHWTPEQRKDLYGLETVDGAPERAARLASIKVPA